MTRLSGAPPARPLSTAFAGLLEPHEKISDTLRYNAAHHAMEMASKQLS